MVTIELMEQRQLLAFTPSGAPVIAQAGNVDAVESMAGLADGRHVLTWVVDNDLFVRLYNADKTPVSAAVQVNTSGIATAPDVTISGAGDFVVVWQQDDVDGPGIFMRQFTATGAAVAPPVQVNTTTTTAQVTPRVASATDGSFAVVWQSDQTGAQRIYQQRFNANGTPNGAEVLASDDNVATAPDISMTGSGAYIVAWNSAAATLAQRYTNAGAAQGGLITVANVTDSQPAVGIATDGSFVVAYSVDEDGAGPGLARDVLAKRYNNTAVQVGTTITAPSNPAGDEQFPQLEVGGSGKFAIGWAEASTTPSTFDQVAFRAFTSGGASLGNDTVVNTVTFSATNRFGLVWRDGTPVRVAYASAGNALIQTFESQLTIELGDAGNTLQLFGLTGVIRVNENGTITNYADDLFTSIAITGGDGADYIRAKKISMNMTVFGGLGNDTIVTGSGNDYVEGGLGNDVAQLSDGDDYAIGNDEQDTLYGGNGSDTLTGGPGRNELHGEAGNDLLNGGNRPDTLFGEAGDDRIRARAGGDALFGGDGNDSLDGSTGNDGILGEDGDDTLIGDLGNDTLRGGAGFDQLRAGNDMDRLYGDAGFDVLNGEDGTDFGYTDGLDALISIEVRRNVT